MVTLEHGLRHDEHLAQRIHDALLDMQPLNLLALPTVRVSIDDGHVRLSGNVATASQAVSMAAAVRDLAGVKSVANALVDDGSLTLDAWLALNALPELRGKDRRLRLVFGTAYIDWAVRCPELERAADEALAGLAGIRQVVHGQWREAGG